MVGDLEAGAARNAGDRLLELCVLERHHRTAAIADQVMMVLAGRAQRLVAGGARANLQSLHEAQALELLEGTVDAGPPDAEIAPPQLVLDLVGAQRAVLLAQQLDHRPARTPFAEPRAVQGLQSVLDPILASRSRAHNGNSLDRPDQVAAIAAVTRVPRVANDTAVAIVVTTLFGLGALLALSPSSPPGIQNLLFGDILGVSDTDLLLAGGGAVVALGALRLLHRQLLAVGFDRDGARALGASPALAETALLMLIALAVLIAVQGLGNLLVVAALVGPAATARQVCSRLLPMMAVAAAVAILGGAIGLYLSYYAGTAAGASVACAMVAVYVLTAIAATWSGRSRELPL